MATSAIAIAQESSRSVSARDDNYYRKMVYYFELRLPETHSPDVVGTYFFPLMVNPGSYSMDEPFAMEETTTLGGGLYVEENGIIRRVISLSGNTGFRPRNLQGVNKMATSALSPEQKSFGRNIPKGVAIAISGQRHFQYLQDAAFRTYADFKRDPATSEKTQMIFHNPKDQEHWLVKPMSFRLERDKSKPTLWNYNIQMLAVAPADSVDKDFSEDKDLLDKMKDGLDYVQSGIDTAAGALNDVTAIAGDIENVVSEVGQIISSVGTVLNAASDLVNGVSSLIQSPLALLDQANSLIESALRTNDTLFRAGDEIASLPDNVVQKFRQMEDGLNRIGTHPDLFENPVSVKLENVKAQQDSLRLTTDTGTSPPTTKNEAALLGTTSTTGDVQTASGRLSLGGSVIKYTGSRRIFLAHGDTLANLAARYLGDSRLWQHIAVLNDLKPPFVIAQADTDLTSEDAVLSGVKGTGDSLLIPTFAKAPKSLPLLPVLGVRSEKSAEEHLLGTDIAVELAGGRTGAPLYDIPIDVEGGSVDVKVVRGIPNIGQALTMRVNTEKGADTLYKKAGMDRVIGFNIQPVDLELSRFRFVECLGQDPRVSSVRSLDLDANQGDALIMDADVELRGFTESATVKSKL